MKGRSTSVVSVRLPDELATSLRGEARRRHMLLNDYLKLILTTHLKLPAVVPVITAIKPSKGDKRVTRQIPEDDEDKIDDGGFEDEVKKENENNLPREDLFTAYIRKFLTGLRDSKGNIIPESTWHFAMGYRNTYCPCGSGKRFKKCHGITEGEGDSTPLKQYYYTPRRHIH